jgi:hypothetical protein
MDPKNRKQLIQEHIEAISSLEAEATGEAESASWPPSGFYLLWHVVVGMAIGGLAAMISLAANVIGAQLFGVRALELVRVYLTFPMGERALHVGQGEVLFIGCVLYLVTGALFGVLFHLLFTTVFADASTKKRFIVATLLGLGLWIVNFYLVLSWLQPLLLGDNWIVRMVPPWVGALTHLAFAWTMAASEAWGRFEPYRRSTDPITDEGAS